MQTNRQVRVWTTTAAIVLLTMTSGMARQEPAGEASQQDRAIAGSWEETVTITGGPSFRELRTFGSDGTVMASAQGSVITGPFPYPNVATVLHGSWARRGRRTFSTTMAQLGSDPYDGTLLYVLRLWETVTLDRSANTYHAVYRQEYRDPAGNLIFGFDGTVEGRRIAVEPLD